MDESFIIFKRAVTSEKYGVIGMEWGHHKQPETVVGITSTRPGESSDMNMVKMKAFRDELGHIEGVSNVHVARTHGYFLGGDENTWNVSYDGNGKARELLAKTGQKHNQDAVFKFQMQDKPSEDSVQIDELNFGTVSGSSERVRKAAEDAMTKIGIGGATWFNDIDTGEVKLRIAQVPWYVKDRKQHDKMVEQLQNILSSPSNSDYVKTDRKTKYASFEGFEHDTRGDGSGTKYKDVIGKHHKSMTVELLEKSEKKFELPQMKGLGKLKNGMNWAIIVDKNKMKK